MFVGGIEYNCVERYMMHQKVVFFRDEETAKEILASSHQPEIKALGRRVRNFEESVWVKNREDIVKRGIVGKFAFNPDLMAKFLAFPKGSVFVECSPWDTIWGIGIGVEDDRRLDTNKCRGSNLLGKVLTEVRNSWG